MIDIILWYETNRWLFSSSSNISSKNNQQWTTQYFQLSIFVVKELSRWDTSTPDVDQKVVVCIRLPNATWDVLQIGGAGVQLTVNKTYEAGIP